MNHTDLKSLKALSIEVISTGIVGNAMMAFMAVIAITMSTMQVLTILLYKPLRDLQQILVINAAFGDASKSIGYMLVSIKRLILASFGYDQVISQSDCMYWIWMAAFGSMYGVVSVLALSMERLLVIATPVWFKQNGHTLARVLAMLSFSASLIASFGIFFGISSELILPSCALLSSTTQGFYAFLEHFQNVTTATIIIVNCATGLLLVKRWRQGLKSGANMNELKKAIQLNAAKAVFSVVALCLISFFSGMIFMTMIQDFDRVSRFFCAPFWGCLQLIRGVFDFGIWMIFNKKYKAGFVQVILRGRCGSQVQPTQNTGSQPGQFI